MDSALISTINSNLFMKAQNKSQVTLLKGIVCTGVLLAAGVASGQTLFEADYGSGTVNAFTSSGMQTYGADLNGPNGLALDTQGNLYVANSLTGIITKITPGGTESQFAAGLNSPWGVAVNNSGDVFVSSQFGNTITEITPGENESTFVTGLDEPYDIAFNSAGDLFEADWGSGTINEYLNVG